MNNLKILGVMLVVDAINHIKNSFDVETRAWVDEDGYKHHQHIVSADRESVSQSLTVEFPDKNIDNIMSYLFDELSPDGSGTTDCVFKQS